MWKLFEKRDTKYELSTENLLQTPNVNTITTGENSLISGGAHLWNTLPDDIKIVNSTIYLVSSLFNFYSIVNSWYEVV